MKVLLVSVNQEDFPDPIYPVGVGLVAAAATRAGHDAQVVDLRWHPDAVAIPPAGFAPDVVGLSIRNVDNLTWGRSCSYVPQICAAADRLRNWFSGPVVLGGSGYSLFPRELLAALGGDFGVVGEGEETFPLLLGELARGGDPAAVPGVVARAGAGGTAPALSATPSAGPHRRGAELIGRYSATGTAIGVQTKRGCPFACSYCTYPALEGKRLRLREPGDVVAELRELAGMGVRRVFFVDDAFNVPAEHAEALCRAIVEADVPISWSAFAHPRELSGRLASWMRRSGCAGLEFGTDSLSDPVLEELQKGFTVAQVRETAAAVAREGIPAAHYLLLGGPGETDETLQQGLAEADALPPAAFIAMVGVRVYPGTPLEARARADGRIGAGQGLLEPAFYVSPHLDTATVLERVAHHARRRRAWVVPAAGVRSDASALARGRATQWPTWRSLLR